MTFTNADDDGFTTATTTIQCLLLDEALERKIFDQPTMITSSGSTGISVKIEVVDLQKFLQFAFAQQSIVLYCSDELPLKVEFAFPFLGHIHFYVALKADD